MSTEPESFRADFLEYHRSIAAELAAVKDRVDVTYPAFFKSAGRQNTPGYSGQEIWRVA